MCNIIIMISTLVIIVSTILLIHYMESAYIKDENKNKNKSKMNRR